MVSARRVLWGGVDLRADRAGGETMGLACRNFF
jgi:hypothetical protein